ncbi:peptidase C14, caspase domain-containing protein [Crucibulum laeve]|uniref:Peptidase C14, caspase domain-containing protein n=1 Tax=Crucibulum laeve TaxID=68775 RepID=A0A5C3M1A8_9AGAR|nr:peptidase C14, caspase domain-containing protein [Crucibulum laeve]
MSLGKRTGRFLEQSAYFSTLGAALVKAPRRKALLIGINYSDLKVPQVDVIQMRLVLIFFFHYRAEDIVLMSDDPSTPAYLQPTQNNILRELKAFVRHARPNDHYFFLYAGHSSQRKEEVKCVDKKDLGEQDGLDEFVMPLDSVVIVYNEAEKRFDHQIIHDKVILDDLLHDYLVKPLVPGSQLTAIFDTCHSGTLLDLNHYRCNRVCEWTSSVRRAQRKVLVEGVLEPLYERFNRPNTWTQLAIKFIRGADMLSVPKFCSGYCARKDDDNNYPYVICISACKDSQLIYEVGNRSMTAVRIFK